MEKKIYANKKEKVADFFIGFIVVPLALFLLEGFLVYSLSALFGNFVQKLLLIIFSLFYLGLIIYALIKRTFVGLGMLCMTVVVPLVLLGTCFMIFRLGNR